MTYTIEIKFEGGGPGMTLELDHMPARGDYLIIDRSQYQVIQRIFWPGEAPELTLQDLGPYQDD